MTMKWIPDEQVDELISAIADLRVEIISSLLPASRMSEHDLNRFIDDHSVTEEEVIDVMVTKGWMIGASSDGANEYWSPE